MGIRDWLDERSGYRALGRLILDEPVPGGARWSYVWGSCLVFVLLVQAATGVALATSYTASTTTAWASVAYTQDQAPLGWLVRGLHAAGASALVILLCAHLLQTAIWGAYRKPRELNWLFGLALLGLGYGFALTGYLLPWDQKGYFATQVATSLLGSTPGIGPSLQRLVQGGPGYGNLTLTRFYALHVLVLPAALGTLVAAHVALFRRHGITPSWRLAQAELSRRAVRFWPDQLLRDGAAMLLVLAAMSAWTIARHGAPLDAPADPSSSYDARPEWYFLPLFQALKLFPGSLETAAALGLPLFAFGLLAALPFLDRGADRAPRARLKLLAIPLGLFAVAVLLGVQARVEDAGNPDYQAGRERADREAAHARALALKGVPPSGGTAVYDADPARKAARVLAERCLGCHQLDGKGAEKAPTLDGWSSRAWIAGLLHAPSDPRYYGRTKIKGMGAVHVDADAERSLVEFVYAQGADGPEDVDEELRARGQKRYQLLGCDECHETDGASGLVGPNFGGRASAGWINAFLADPGAPRFFGRKNEMPKIAEKLSAEELEAVVAFLRAQRRP